MGTRSKEVMITSDEALRVAVVGGVDPSGGAGIGRDASTLASVGATPLLVATALTVQDEYGVARVEPVDVDLVERSLHKALASGADAVKLGMLHRAAVVASILHALEQVRVPVVFDPVLFASSGGRLAEADLIGALPDLASVTTIITPNLEEARSILGERNLDSASASVALVEAGWHAAIVTGGDARGALATDALATPAFSRLLVAARVPGRSPRGTGCAFASLVAAALGRGNDLEQACRRAKGQLYERIRDGESGMLATSARPVWPHAAHPFE